MQLLALSAFLMGLAIPAGELLAEQSLVMAPFEILKDQPGCTDSGDRALRVAFDATAAARLSYLDRPQATVQSCTIKTRRGGQIQAIPIPCPMEGAATFADDKELNPNPSLATVSGVVTLCLGVTQAIFLSAAWQIQVDTPSGIGMAKGDLTAPELSILMSSRNLAAKGAVLANPQSLDTSLALLWDRALLTIPNAPTAALTVSSYVLLQAAGPGADCVADCPYGQSDVAWRVRMIGDRSIGDLMDFVEGN